MIRNDLGWNCFCDLGRGELGTACFEESLERHSNWFRPDCFRTISSARIEYLALHRVQDLKTVARVIYFFIVKKRMHYLFKFSNGSFSRFLLSEESVSLLLSSRIFRPLENGSSVGSLLYCLTFGVWEPRNLQTTTDGPLSTIQILG